MDPFSASHGLNLSGVAQSNFVLLAGQILMILYYVIYILIIMRIIFSIIMYFGHHFNISARVPDKFSQFVVHATDPLLKPFALIIPVGPGAVDLSPVILLKCIELARNITAALVA